MNNIDMNSRSNNRDSGEINETIYLSILIPIYNEHDNIPLLFSELLPILDRMQRTFEIIAVDDGSKDGSMAALRTIAAQLHELRLVSFRRNCGQTAAIMSAIDHAGGAILISIA